MKQNTKGIMSCNIQGLNSEAKQRLLADDFVNKKLSVMLLQETKIQKNEQITIESSNNTKLTLYNSGHKNKSLKGVAVLVRENTKINFQAITERICIAEIKLDENKNKICALSVYAPTEEETEKYPEKTDDFYNRITTVINNINKRDTLVIGGDFNARTKLATQEERELYKDIVGKYARNEINENGKYLIEFCKIHNLQLVNTMFKHKPSQQVTWESALHPKKPRKNPYRFQIDYIAVRKNKCMKLIDARSYNTIRANSDHKPVIVTFKIHTNRSKPVTPKKTLNIPALQDPIQAEEYKNKVEENLINQKEPENIQDKWTNIIKATLSSRRNNWE